MMLLAFLLAVTPSLAMKRFNPEGAMISTMETPVQVEVETGLGCSCGGGSISYWSAYEDLPDSNAGSGCIGGCGGGAFAMHDYMTTVRDLRVWWGHGVDHDGFKAIQVVFFNGEQQTAGSLPASGPDASFTFAAGEMLSGQITICGNGVGTRTGYLHFKTNLGNEFSAGNQHTPYYFEADGTLLAGFFGQSGSDIDQLGLYLFKSIDQIHVTGINYPTLDSYMAGLSPSSIVDRPYCNNSGIDQHEDRTVTIASGSKESWSYSETESFEMSVSISVTAGVPEVESAEETTSFKWGMSATQSYSMEQDTTTTVQEELHFYYPAHTMGDITYTQFDSNINVPWQGYEHITFKDGSTISLNVNGVYAGVYISKISPQFEADNCNPCQGGYCANKEKVVDLSTLDHLPAPEAATE